jgi:hypothetical protein
MIAEGKRSGRGWSRASLGLAGLGIALLAVGPAPACSVPVRVHEGTILDGETVVKAELLDLRPADVADPAMNAGLEAEAALVLSFRTLHTCLGREQEEWDVAWLTSAANAAEPPPTFAAATGVFLVAIEPRDRTSDPRLWRPCVKRADGTCHDLLHWKPCMLDPAALPFTEARERQMLQFLKHRQ